MTVWPTANTAVTIVDATGAATAIAAKSTDLHDIAAAINASGKGVAATVVAAGKDGDGNALSRLQLSSKTAGAGGAFRLYAGTVADVRAGTAATAIASTLSSAQDAQITLYPGTSSAQVVTSSGNTFEGLLQGIDVTVSAPTASAVTLTSSTDAKSVGSNAAALVAAVTQIVQFIDTNSKDQTKTNADGSTTTTPASFAGDSTISAFRFQIIKAVSAPLGAGATVSPARYGFTLNPDGTIDVDAPAFAAAIAADLTGTVAAVQQISTRIA
ncbi:hypothetical protein ATY41_09790 [Leifsonia xyli subsp. xyli]|uniref:Flagellar hook-associated protein 2 C-terminal domain-containing protein n=1 Tax=Leifsonia xyli subsp. xyli TaxID=59736 RepID=A0A1E2SL89_LEIXY|nr:flagellar filament capping protein FliD [Leifsonia xyli]ODA90527.1 hypothetical protein ATY41_09790 [Leifsonia xyli subsp. xyli]